MKRLGKKIAALGIASIFAVSTFGASVSFAADDDQAPATFEIVNPYQNVDWAATGHYKSDFHAHSTNSDGSNLTRDMVEDHYTKGFDVLAMTDHDYLTESWDTKIWVLL